MPQPDDSAWRARSRASAAARAGSAASTSKLALARPPWPAGLPGGPARRVGGARPPGRTAPGSTSNTPHPLPDPKCNAVPMPERGTPEVDGGTGATGRRADNQKQTPRKRQNLYKPCDTVSSRRARWWRGRSRRIGANGTGRGTAFPVIGGLARAPLGLLREEQRRDQARAVGPSSRPVFRRL